MRLSQSFFCNFLNFLYLPSFKNRGLKRNLLKLMDRICLPPLFLWDKEAKGASQAKPRGSERIIVESGVCTRREWRMSLSAEWSSPQRTRVTDQWEIWGKAWQGCLRVRDETWVDSCFLCGEFLSGDLPWSSRDGEQGGPVLGSCTFMLGQGKDLLFLRS